MKYNIKELFDLYQIKSITSDSRTVKSGSAFFASKSKADDGNNYIQDAIAKGAMLVFTDCKNTNNNWSSQGPAVLIFVSNIHTCLFQAAAILYPKLPKYIVAVTGTNGKSSVASYVQQLFELLGQKSASIGTIGIHCVNPRLNKYFLSQEYNNLTTLDQISLREVLDKLASYNIDYVSLEASSHGLDQNRLQGVLMQAAAFTSFSQDHLDYHSTMGEYLTAKLKLFADNLVDGGRAIINKEIKEFKIIKKHLLENNKKIFEIGDGGDIEIKNIEANLYGQKIQFFYRNKEYIFSTEIIGNFQVYNILIGVGLVMECGFDFEEIVPHLCKLKAPSGRLERVSLKNDRYQIFIDYAHTPDALEKSLLTLQKIKQNHGKLKVLFGCGGNRDQSKRKIMGEVAAKFADEVIITDDNPRNEDARIICEQILTGASNATIIAGRKTAIKKVIMGLNQDDILLIAGKGHEKYQIIGNKKILFSDMKIAKQMIKLTR